MERKKGFISMPISLVAGNNPIGVEIRLASSLQNRKSCKNSPGKWQGYSPLVWGKTLLSLNPWFISSLTRLS
jgi:hypothetical protein